MAERTSIRVNTTPEYAAAALARADRWVAACGGLEVPFTHQGTRYLYVWNPRQNTHGYLNLDTDIVEEEDPAFR